MENNNSFFENENDRQMYELLFVLKNGTKEDLMQYIHEHTPTEEEHTKFIERHQNQTREEIKAELADQIMQIQKYLSKKYFITGTESSGGNN